MASFARNNRNAGMAEIQSSANLTKKSDGNRAQTPDHKRAVQAAVVGAGEAGGSHADRDFIKREAKFFTIDAAARRDDRLTRFSVAVLRLLVEMEAH